MKKLSVIVTHPIQYYSPLFRKLSESGEIELKVCYTWSQAQGKKHDPGFGKDVEWDIPLLEGYAYTFVNNISKEPGSHHYNGIVNPTLIKEIEDWKAEAVLIIGWNFNSHLKAMRYFKGKIPVYFRGDSTLLDEQPGIKKIMRRVFLRWVYKHIDYAFYVGQRNKEYFLAHGLTKEQLIFAPHAIDNNSFYDKDGTYEKRAIEWRNSLGIKDDDFVFLFAGKLEPKKNPAILIKAIKQLNNPAIHLILVGNGILENELKKIAFNNATIHFLDFQNQSIMPVVYRLGNIFILPSQSETWGLAVNEAMACGLPVVVSDKVGCAVDLVDNEKIGFVFKSNDEEELKTVLNYCYDKWVVDKKKFYEMRLNSINKIQGYSIDKLTENIVTSLVRT